MQYTLTYGLINDEPLGGTARRVIENVAAPTTHQRIKGPSLLWGLSSQNRGRKVGRLRYCNSQDAVSVTGKTIYYHSGMVVLRTWIPIPKESQPWRGTVKLT